LLSKSLQKLKLTDITTLALFISLAVAGRALFAPIPSVQPSSYFIIMCGLLFGPGGGFCAGVLTAILSNLLLGFGTYIWFQMLAWGLMGLFAGLLPKRNLFLTPAYGFIWGYLFGFITNFWYLFAGNIPITFSSIMIGTAGSFTFDTAHAVTNLILLVFLPYGVVYKIQSKIIGSHDQPNLKKKGMNKE